MYAFIYIYLNTEYRYISFVIAVKSRSSHTKCIAVHKNTFCTYISVPMSLKNFHVIKNFHFLLKFNSERGIDIHLCIQDEQETQRRHTKQNKQRN